MADENIVTNIVAKSDFSNLIADLNKVSFSLTKLQEQLVASNKMLASQVSVMNRSFADTLRSTGQFSTHFVSLTSDVDKFGSQLDRGQIKLGKFFQVYRQHAATSGGLIRDLAKQQVQLQNAIMQPLGRNAEGLMQYNVHIPRGLDLIKNKSAIAKQELQILNKVVQEGANQLINWGKNTQWAGRQLTVGLTVPLAAFGKASADAFRVADQELTRLTKVYGGIAATSAQELGKVRADVTKTASEISKAYGVSFNETIGLAADIAATGKTGNELLGSIQETTRLAVLGEVDRQDAMKATLAIQSAFKANTEELADSINFLNSVENQTSTTLNDLVEAIPKAGPIIKGLGGDVQDLALYLTAMREGGISASEGANALKSGLASLINPTKVAKDMFAGFGISLTDIVQKNAGNTTATLLSLQAALDRLDPLQKQQALEQLFGKFQFARMNALFENLGRQGSQTLQVMDLMKASSQELADLAGRELTQVTESASGKYRRAVEGLKADLAGIGEQFLKINTSLINFVDGIIKFVQKLPDPIKQALGFMGMLTAAAGPLIMLTGVLGNFFGYIIKGAYHFKSLFKGGEGWKLLTPEILAAQKAGNLVEQTFYNDAAAANILKKSIHDLTLEFELLQQRAQSGSIAVNPGIQTAAGNVVMNAGTPRVVNNKSKYLGKPGSRDFSHQNPTAGKTEAEKMAETIFAVTPGTKPVNQRVSANPQIFAQGDLPAIQGLTRVNNVSTGIVATEAAKWHALTGTLSMLTKREVNALKKEIATTGTFSAEISQTFAQLLGPLNNITNNAAKQSALIVKQLQQQKITLDVARQRIIELNAQTEALMAKTTSDVAQSLGRTANLTAIPLTNQAVVDASGKSNFKELFRKDRAATNVLSKIASALGVKTWGGSYSTETTIPKKLNLGGYVYTANDGSIVPGPNVNADVVPAMLTPGEFVVNAEATKANLPLLQAINGAGSNGPGYSEGSNGPVGPQPYLSTSKGSSRPMIPKSILDTLFPGRLTDRASQTYYEPKGNAGIFGGEVSGRSFSATTSKINTAMDRNGIDPRVLLASINSRGGGPRLSTDVFLNGLSNAGVISKEEKRRLSKNIFNEYARSILSMERVNDRNNPVWSISNRILSQHFASNPIAQSAWRQYSRSPGSFAHPTRRASTGWLNKMNINGTAIRFANLEASGQNKFYHSKELENPFVSTINELINPPARQAPTQTNRLLRPMVGQKNPLGPGNFNPAALGPNPALYGIEAHGRNTFLGNIVRKVGGKYLTPHAIAMGATRTMSNGRVFHNYTKANRGGLIGLNRGGLVPGYQRGGMVGATLGIAGSMLGYQGGSMLGQQAFGDVGSMVGGIAGSMAVPGLMSKLSSSTNSASSSLGKFAAVSRFLGPWGMAAGAGLTAVAFALNKYKNGLEETGKLNRLAFAGGVKPLQDFDTKLKDVTKSIENARTARELLNTQFTSAGLPGLVLTADQFGKLKDEIAKTYPQLVKLIEKTSTQDLFKVAEGLKAQFVAAGDSAASANAKIASLLQLGGKGGMMAAILGDKSVKDIRDASSAITSMINTLSSGFKGDTAQSVESMLQLFTSADQYISTQKDASAGVKTILDKISNSSAKNLTITNDQLAKIREMYPELGNVLNSTDSVGAAFAKWRIVLSGVTKDLSGLSEKELSALAEYATKISTYFDKIKDVASKEAQSNAVTGEMAKAIDKFNKAQVSASKNVIANIDAQIKSKEKLIEAIKKEADARKKALQDQQSAEDTKLQIQKEQLAYQDALATGNMAAAAQAQLNIQRLVGQSQLKSAETAIDAEAQRKIDALQRAIESLDKRAEGISESTQSAKTVKSPLEEIYGNITGFLKDVALNNPKGNFTEEQLTTFNSYLTQLSRIPGGQKYIDQLSNNGPVSMATDRSEGGMGNALGGGNVTRKLLGSSQGAALGYDLQAAIGSNQIAAGMGPTNKILSDILTVLSKTGNAATKTNAVVTTGTAGGISYAYTSKASLDKAGVDLAPGALFKDKGGRTWKVVNINGSNVNVESVDTTMPKTTPGVRDTSRAGKAYGGFIRGAGTGTSDSIPAMLSNGEYVINASAVRAVGTPMLDQINKMAMGGLATRYDIPSKTITSANTMGYNRGGMVQHYNVGGLVINTQPGQNEMEIARMAVNMMNAQNAVASKSIGMNKVIGR